MSKTIKASIIIATYNWPEALELVLTALNFQTCLDFEVIVADDGSKPVVKNLVENFKANYKLKHVWQEDLGFRAARVRNLAAKKASSDYFIFIDADCMVRNNFVAQHIKLKENGFFVFANRVLLSENFTKEVIANKTPVYSWGFLDFYRACQQKKINRLLPVLTLPLGPLRKFYKSKWQGVKSCNLAIHKDDFLKVNGFDEAYVGWGYEDSDLVIRLFKSGVKRKSGKFKVPVLHLWHKEHDRSNEQKNFSRLDEQRRCLPGHG